MAHCKQALKRIRQSEKRRIRGKSARASIKTTTKTLAEAVAQKNAASAQAILREVSSQIDKAAKIHVYHRNAAARYKSRLARSVASLGAATAPSS